MKLQTFCAFAVASLLSAPSLFAQIGTGSLNITAPNYNGTGGNGDQAGPYLVQISAVATGVIPPSAFQTFCVGSEINYTPGTPYDYQISGTVEPSGPQPNGVGAPGYVTLGTAYLYSQFLAGSLGIGGSTTTVASGVGNEQINDALQAAIWYLQGQSLAGIQFGPDGLDTALYNQFLTDAANGVGAGNVENNAAGAYGVYALNMLSAQGAYAQPELVQIAAPVPESSTVFAGAILLVPLGLSALRRVRTVSRLQV